VDGLPVLEGDDPKVSPQADNISPVPNPPVALDLTMLRRSQDGFHPLFLEVRSLLPHDEVVVSGGSHPSTLATTLPDQVTGKTHSGAVFRKDWRVVKRTDYNSATETKRYVPARRRSVRSTSLPGSWRVTIWPTDFTDDTDKERNEEQLVCSFSG
jgi:hypothetical protein